MKVFYDVLSINNPGGIPVYVEKLAEALSRIRDIDLCFFDATIKTSKIKYIKKSASEKNIDIDVKQIFCPGRIFRKIPSLVRNKIFDDIDLIHAPANFFPDFCPENHHLKKILTLHDVGYISPGALENGLVEEKLLPILLERVARDVEIADLIITVSEFSRQEICRQYNLDPQKVKCVHIAPQNDFCYDKASAWDFLKNNNLSDGKFFLSVSTITKRKNYLNLLRAFEHFLSKHPEAKLVIVGPPGWHYEEILEKFEDMKDNVLWLKYCKWEELCALYYHARAFFLVSWYEGFGIPVLEAMQAGCPVCYSTGNSMTEIVGDDGIAVAPDSVDEIEYAMQRLWNGDDLCAKLKSSGPQVAAKFNWGNTAEATYEIYRKLIT